MAQPHLHVFEEPLPADPAAAIDMRPALEVLRCPSVMIFGSHMYHWQRAVSPVISMIGLITPCVIQSTVAFGSGKPR